MKKSLVTVLLASLFTAGVVKAQFSSEPTDANLRSSDFIFVGYVFDTVAPSKTGDYDVSVQVLESIKGNLPEEVRVVSSPKKYGVELMLGSTYLFHIKVEHNEDAIETELGEDVEYMDYDEVPQGFLPFDDVGFNLFATETVEDDGTRTAAAAIEEVRSSYRELSEKVLYFASSDELAEVVRMLAQMTDEEVEAWEEDQGFLSYASMQQNPMFDQHHWGAEDPVLARLLNGDGELHVGAKSFRVNRDKAYSVNLAGRELLYDQNVVNDLVFAQSLGVEVTSVSYRVLERCVDRYARRSKLKGRICRLSWDSLGIDVTTISLSVNNMRRVARVWWPRNAHRIGISWNTFDVSFESGGLVYSGVVPGGETKRSGRKRVKRILFQERFADNVVIGGIFTKHYATKNGISGQCENQR